MIQAITFDFWQTLYSDPPQLVLERNRVRAAGIVRHLASLGCGRTLEAIQAAMAVVRQRSERVWQEQARTMPLPEVAGGMADLLHLRPSDEILAGIAQAMQSAVLEVPPRLLPGVPDTLRRLATRMPVGLICDTGFSIGDQVREILRRDGLLAHFSCLTFSDEIGTSKPNLRNFQVTLEALKADPGHAAHVGDLLETDMLGAKRAGMRAILYWGAGYNYETTEPADEVIHDHSELLKFIQ